MRVEARKGGGMKRMKKADRVSGCGCGGGSGAISYTSYNYRSIFQVLQSRENRARADAASEA